LRGAVPNGHAKPLRRRIACEIRSLERFGGGGAKNCGFARSARGSVSSFPRLPTDGRRGWRSPTSAVEASFGAGDWDGADRASVWPVRAAGRHGGSSTELPGWSAGEDPPRGALRRRRRPALPRDPTTRRRSSTSSSLAVSRSCGRSAGVGPPRCRARVGDRQG
jgi:hypothetical protein